MAGRPEDSTLLPGDTFSTIGRPANSQSGLLIACHILLGVEDKRSQTLQMMPGEQENGLTTYRIWSQVSKTSYCTQTYPLMGNPIVRGCPLFLARVCEKIRTSPLTLREITLEGA
jgi:hypothetical protein